MLCIEITFISLIILTSDSKTTLEGVRRSCLPIEICGYIFTIFSIATQHNYKIFTNDLFNLRKYSCHDFQSRSIEPLISLDRHFNYMYACINILRFSIIDIWSTTISVNFSSEHLMVYEICNTCKYSCHEFQIYIVKPLVTPLFLTT